MINEDPEFFFETFRMSPVVFEELLATVGPHLQKNSAREFLCPKERLLATLS